MSCGGACGLGGFGLHLLNGGPSIRGGGSTMTLSGSVHKEILKFAAVAFLVSAAFAQAPPKYDPATETTIKGTVDQLKFVPPTGAKAMAYLLMKSGADTVQVFLCPKSFLDDMGAEFKAGEEIQVVGSKVKQDGADLILAREVA